MPGAIILVLILIAFPIIVGLSTAGIAALIGFFLHRDAEIRHAGSELVELNNLAQQPISLFATRGSLQQLMTNVARLPAVG